MAVPGLFIQGLTFLAPAEAQEALATGALLLDLRSEDLWAMKRFAVPEALHIPHRELPQRIAEVPAGRRLVLADSSGVFLRAAAALLQARGFDQVACLNGGMLAWDQAGLPVDTDAGALLHGECACVMKSKKGNP